MSLSMIINPGTGDVPDATEENALANMRAFQDDLKLEGAIEREGEEDRGRFPFRLRCGAESVLIEMPGLPLDRVRYVSNKQNPWHFPRLYVDGSSWLWLFAVTQTLLALRQTDAAEAWKKAHYGD